MRKVVVLESEVTVKLEVHVNFDPGSPDVNMRNPNVAACPGSAPRVTLAHAFYRIPGNFNGHLVSDEVLVDICKALSHADRESIAELALSEMVGG